MSKKQHPEDDNSKLVPHTPGNGEGGGDDVVHSIAIDGLYQSWFLDYASYVILERAVPRIEDGFKPVQRRIMHSLKEMDDGRFNKVANVIGNTMQFHPHGDASIGEAIVNIGQKDLLIETQGNWGDVRTGDSAAAPRYIEARLSKFALDVVYNPQTTAWQLSYDGRKKEPVTLPVKFPLLLAQGVEGIAVGLSTKILPHNFVELIKASIDVLKGRNPKIFPDFPTGGIADFNEYNQGLRGGKIKVRARIEILDKKALVIRDIPFGTTTTSLMESIVKASEKGQIKIKQVIDNTAANVEIQLHLQPTQSPEVALEALYAFTDCEISISPNACVIIEDKPHFMGVNEILKYNTQQTLELLRQELEIRRAELMEKILFSSLEKIFIENRIYRNIEEAESWEEVLATIDKGLKPHKKKFYREITTEDIVKLTEIRIKRISRYDSFKADEMLRGLEKELKETEHHLKNLTDYAIAYFQRLLEKYGKGRERRTEIKSFQSVTAVEVIANNQKLYVNRADGFVGYSLKKDEYITDCSELDDVIVIRKDGKAKVSRIQEKVFMGKDILYVGIFKKGDDRMVYNVIYADGRGGKSFAKRFTIPGVTRDKEYDLTQGNANSKILYLSVNPNGEAETVEVKLSQSSTARKKVFEYDFTELEVKNRSSKGNIITPYPVRKVDFLKAGSSTLSKLMLWYDTEAGRLNRDRRGKYLGKFEPEDQLIAFSRTGTYKITGYDLTNRYEPEKTLRVEKFNAKQVITAVYVDGDTKLHMVKRFLVETITLDKEFSFVPENGSRLIAVTSSEEPLIELEFIKSKDKGKVTKKVKLDGLVEVKGWKAQGGRLSEFRVTKVVLIEEEEMAPEESDSNTENNEVTDADQSPKKKEYPGPPPQLPSQSRSQNQNPSQHQNPWSSERAEQANLFGQPAKPQQSSQSQQQKSQPNLFGQPEKQQQSQSPSLLQEPSQSQASQANQQKSESSGEEDGSEKKVDGDDLLETGQTVEW